MELIAGLGIILFVSSVLGNAEDCVESKDGMRFCYIPRTFIRAEELDSRLSKTIVLKLYRSTDNAFAPYIFNSSHIIGISVIQAEYSLRHDKLSPSLSLLSDSFAGVRGLQLLTLSSLNINFNNENPLAPLGLLVILKISHTNITEVPSEMLASVPKLRELDLSDNHITAIRSNSFASLENLFKLDLKINDITYIEPGAFNGLSQLRVMDLCHNAFLLLPGIFQNNPKLKYLYLSEAFDYNQTNIDIESFDDLPKLTELSLRENGFSNMSVGVFNNLKSLKILDLSKNWFATIPPGAFGQMNLVELNLVENGISVIETDTFYGLRVKKVSLQNNYIQKLKARAFNGLRVDTLDLRGNGLTEINSLDFEGFHTSDLVLSDNYIKTIAKGALKNVVTKRLDLQSNPIADSISEAELGCGDLFKKFIVSYQRHHYYDTMVESERNLCSWNRLEGQQCPLLTLPRIMNLIFFVMK